MRAAQAPAVVTAGQAFTLPENSATGTAILSRVVARQDSYFVVTVAQYRLIKLAGD